MRSVLAALLLAGTFGIAGPLGPITIEAPPQPKPNGPCIDCWH